MKKLLNAQNASMLIIALVMLNNVEHLAWVHYNIARHVFTSQALNWMHSIAVVLIIELAIIVFVHRGQDVFAGVYTFMLFILCLLYYPLVQYWDAAEYGRFLAAIIYSGMFTLSIYYFARMAANRQQADAELHQYQQKYFETERLRHAVKMELNDAERAQQQMAAQLQQANTKLQQTDAELHQLKTELHQLRILQKSVAAACTCRKCGSSFPTEASRRSHEGRCSAVPTIKNAAA